MGYAPRQFTHNGETHSIREWAEILGVGYGCLRQRIRHANGNIERCFNTANRMADKITFNGETHTIREWSEITGVELNRLKARIRLHPDNLSYCFENVDRSNAGYVEYNGKRVRRCDVARKLNVSPDVFAVYCNKHGFDSAVAWYSKPVQKRVDVRGQRRLVLRKFKGRLMRLTDISLATGVAADTLRRRMMRGMKGKKLFSTDKERGHYLKIGGERKTLTEWAKDAGIYRNTVTKRLQKGYGPKHAVFDSSKSVGWRRERFDRLRREVLSLGIIV